MTVLERILARTREDLAGRRARRPLEALRAEVERAPGRFAPALAAPGLGLVAEIKPRSPSKGVLRDPFAPEQFVRAYARYAAAISVLCDAPFFGGGYPLLAEVRRATDLPLLAKDFVVDPYQVYEARRAGADAVLLMVSVLSRSQLGELLDVARGLGMHALVETHDAAELDVALGVGAEVVGVNSRDLRSLEIDLERASRLLAEIPEGRVRVAESGLVDVASVARVRDRADAALIGSALMASDDPAAEIERLGWRPR